MPTELELALQEGGVVQEETDFQKAMREGGKVVGAEAIPMVQPSQVTTGIPDVSGLARAESQVPEPIAVGEADVAGLAQSEELSQPKFTGGVTGQWEELKKYGLGEAISTGVSNITGESSAETIKGIYNVFRHPAKTLGAVATITSGGVSKLIPEGKPKEFLESIDMIRSMDEEDFDMVYDALAEDYGGYENIKRTIAEKPLQAAIDTTMILRGIAGKSSRIAQKAGMPRTAGALKYIDPLHTTKKVYSGITKGMTSGVSEVFGVTTGAGPHAIHEAYIGGEKFRKALRGKVTGKNLYDEAKNSFNAVKADRQQIYNSSFKSLDMDTPLSIGKIKSSVKKVMDEHGIILNNKGKIIRSTIDKGEWKKIEDVLGYIGEQGNVAGDLTGTGFHKLKRFLDSTSKNMINSKGQATTGGSMVGKLRNAVTDELKNVKGYTEMNADYSARTTVLDDIDMVLNLRGKNPQTAITKMTRSLKQNNEYVRDMVDLLEKTSGTEFTETIAGLALNPKVPTGHIGRVITGMGVLGSAATAGAYLVSPWFMAVLGAGSPRLIGEFVNALGRGMHRIKQIPVTADTVLKAGQIQKLTQERPEGSQSTLGGR